MIVTISKTPCIIPRLPIILSVASVMMNIMAARTGTSRRNCQSSSPSNSCLQAKISKNGIANGYITIDSNYRRKKLAKPAGSRYEVFEDHLQRPWQREESRILVKNPPVAKTVLTTIEIHLPVCRHCDRP